MKQIRYRIYGIVDLDTGDSSVLIELLEKIREYGDSDVVGVELVESETPLPGAKQDFKAQKTMRGGIWNTN